MSILVLKSIVFWSKAVISAFGGCFWGAVRREKGPFSQVNAKKCLLIKPEVSGGPRALKIRLFSSPFNKRATGIVGPFWCAFCEKVLKNGGRA